MLFCYLVNEVLEQVTDDRIKNKNNMLFLIILILAFGGSFFLPWWFVAIEAFVPALFLGKTASRSFWAGFGAVFISWVALVLMKSIPNDNILASRVATLVQLPNWILLLLVTALIGGLVGGLSALSGFFVKRAFAKPKAEETA